MAIHGQSVLLHMETARQSEAWKRLHWTQRLRAFHVPGGPAELLEKLLVENLPHDTAL